MSRIAGMRRIRRTMALVVLSAVVLVAGCQGLLFSAMYLWKGNNVPAEFDGLKEKKVVVVCRPLQELSYRVSGAPEEIAREVAGHLKKVKKITVVPPQDVNEWVDVNRWDEFAEIGRAMKADMVVGIDLEAFGLLQSQTVYQGTSKLRVSVFDMSQDGAVVYERHFDEHKFPPNTGVYSTETTEDKFRRAYVADLAEDIAVLFYPHDAHHGLGKDSRALD